MFNPAEKPISPSAYVKKEYWTQLSYFDQDFTTNAEKFRIIQCLLVATHNYHHTD